MNPYSFNFPYHMGYRMPYMTNSFTNFSRIAPFSNVGRMTSRVGLFSRLGNSLGAIRNINWSGLLNNTSKTLGVINQAIPIVKQTGPMLNNMRSMLRLASAFRDETSSNKKKNNFVNNNINNDIEINNTINETKEKDTVVNNSTLPNFFIT